MSEECVIRTHLSIRRCFSFRLMLIDEAQCLHQAPPLPQHSYPLLSIQYQDRKTEGGAVEAIVSLKLMPIVHHKQIKFPALPSEK